VSPRVTAAVALRVLTQLRRDPRTVGLLVGVPSLLIVLLHELFAGREEVSSTSAGRFSGSFLSSRCSSSRR